MSSAVLPITVISASGTACRSPSRKRAADATGGDDDAHGEQSAVPDLWIGERPGANITTQLDSGRDTRVITPVSFDCDPICGPTRRTQGSRRRAGERELSKREPRDATIRRRVYPLLYGLADEVSWQERALCAQTDPESFFPEKGGSTREAKRVCLSCEVRSECLDYALSNDERFGIWGGLSERERRRLKKRAV